MASDENPVAVSEFPMEFAMKVLFWRDLKEEKYRRDLTKEEREIELRNFYKKDLSAELIEEEHEIFERCQYVEKSLEELNDKSDKSKLLAKEIYEHSISMPVPFIEDSAYKNWESQFKKLINQIDIETIWFLCEFSTQSDNGLRAKYRAQKRHQQDPKQLAKMEVKKCWELWRLNKDNYKNKSKFARDMLSKYEELESQQVISRWCNQWELELSQQSK